MKFSLAPQPHAKFVGRHNKCHDRFAFACMDAGMPNSSGTKFGRNPQVGLTPAGQASCTNVLPAHWSRKSVQAAKKRPASAGLF